MEVFKYLKQIYQGKNVLANHIMLFSLLGILAILLNNIFAYLGSGLVYFTFFAVPPSTRLEFSVYVFFAILIVIYLFGYEYKFVNENFCNEKNMLPEFDLMPSVIVLKVFPLFFTWQIYYLFILAIGSFVLFTFGNMAVAYVFYSLLLCLLPFIHLILITFASDFKLKRFYTSFITVFKYLDKTLGDVIFLIIKICVMFIIPAVIIYSVAYFAQKITSESYRLSFYLLDLCFALYAISILRFVYIAGLMNIVKEKFLTNRE